MNYIVTGGAGFIGSNLVDRLINDGHQVNVIDNFVTGKDKNCNAKATYHRMDVADSRLNNKFIEIMQNADGLFHLAALARVQESIEDPMTYEKNNTLGTLNMLKCADDAKVKRFVYSASSAAYGDTQKFPSQESDPTNPISPYAMQKYYGEVCCKMFAEVYNLETVSLRYFNVYGERQNLDGEYALVMSVFARQRLNNEPLTIRGDGEQRRDFTHVSDIANANILAMQSTKVGKGETINIGNSDNRSVNQIAALMGGETINTEAVKEPRETLADNSKAKKLLGWVPKVVIEEWVPIYKKSLGIK